MQAARIATLTTILLLHAGAWGSELEAAVARRRASMTSGGNGACAVMDLADGRFLVAAEAEQPLRLASVTKLFVAAAALSGLGPDFVFRTDLRALGPLRDGALAGLGVIGRGSPCLDEHFTAKDPDRIFRDWAAALAAAGVRRIEGDLVIDADYFSGPAKAPTWPQDHANTQKWYSAPASAFAWNDNCIEARAVPTAPGEPARIEVRPRSPRIRVDNRTSSVAKGGGDRSFLISRAADANALVVKGRYGTTTSWFPMAIHDQPDLLAGDHLAAILADCGIALSGRVRLGGVPTDTVLLHRHEDRLGPAVDLLNQRSQNFYGEQILRSLGAERYGEGSLTAGCRATREILVRLGLDLAGCDLVDGSGLSYDNRASAATVCRLLRCMASGPQGAAFSASLKEDGPRRRIKTGTLAVARCLAGYLDGPDGRRYAFCILVDRGSARSFAWGTALKDQLYAEISALTRP